MVTLNIDCVDPNDYEKVVEAAEKAAGSCNITYAKQHEEMVKAGTSKSRKESSRKIAKESGETPGAVEQKIMRGEKALHPVAEKETTEKTGISRKVEKLENSHGGTRKGAGRKPKKDTAQVDLKGPEEKALHPVAEKEKTVSSEEINISELIEEKIQNGMSVYEASKAVIEEQTDKTEAGVNNDYQNKINIKNAEYGKDIEKIEDLASFHEKLLTGDESLLTPEEIEIKKKDQERTENDTFGVFNKNTVKPFVYEFERVADKAAGSDFQEPLLMKARILRTTLDYYIKKWE